MRTGKVITIVGVGLMLLVTPAAAQTFPPAGDDPYVDEVVTFEVAMFEPYGPGPGIWFPGELVGPFNVHRDDPYPDTGLGGDEAIDVEMTYMDLTGHVGGMPSDLILNPQVPTTGRIIDTNPEPGNSFPAYSFFDIFFEITVNDPVHGALDIVNQDALFIASTINEIPPDLSETPYYQVGVIDLYLKGTTTVVGQLRNGIHPEPGTLLLLAFGSLAVLRRRRR